MRTVDDYLALITPYHRSKPNFTSTIVASTESFADDQVANYSMYSNFDVDTAIGEQLNTIGLWVGVPRVIPVPVPDPWFAFDTFGLGWDQGYWYLPYEEGTEFQSLDDDDYRRLIKAKIIANGGNGQFPDAQAAMNEFFSSTPATLAYVEDRNYALDGANPDWFSWDDEALGWDLGNWQDDSPLGQLVERAGMSVVLGISGIIPSPVDLAILASNLIPIAPAGVRYEVLVVSTDIAGGVIPVPSVWENSIPGAGLFSSFALGGTTISIAPSGGDDVISTPMFGFDMENDYISGWDVGAWGVSPEFLLAL